MIFDSVEKAFNELEQNGVILSEKDKKAVEEKVTEMLSYEPRIGVFGKTGAGKSSLCNALFGKAVCPISDVEACTREPQEVFIDENGLTLIDVPGVGENCERDAEYEALYKSLIPELDLILWVLKADDRAYGADEELYSRLVKPHIEQGKPFFFVLNQSDKIEPFREWDIENHQPGEKQLENIERKVKSAAECFDIDSSNVIPVSANEKYNLTYLVDEIISALPDEKKVTVFREVNEEFRSEESKRKVSDVFWDVAGNVVEGASNVFCGVLDAAEGVIDIATALMPWNW